MQRLKPFLVATLLLVASLPSQAAPAAHAAAPQTILTNGSFETGSYSPRGVPEGWARRAFSGTADFAWRADAALVGQHSVEIFAPIPNDAWWQTTVPVRPHTRYVLSGWIKTEEVARNGGDAGANLSIIGTWTHTEGVVGTNDWTYVYLPFDTGDQQEVTVGARLGYWANTTTGTAWFDGVRLTEIGEDSEVPPWRILVLIYETTDFTFVDTAGVKRHVVARMSGWELGRAAREATAFVTQDIPALTSGIMTPTVTIRYPSRPLTRLSRHDNGWWPAPWDTLTERDPDFDSVIVIWDPRTLDQSTGEAIWIGSAAGLTPAMGTGQTYATQIIESTMYGHRNVFKHEWGHSLLSYFEAAGTAPRPAVTNHATPGQYVHCPTGEPYVWVDESDLEPIPNSIYHNVSGFTHDYYSGAVATPDQPARCLGITRAAWATGGPASRPAYYPYYHQLELASSHGELVASPGEIVRHQLTLTNTGNMTDTFYLALEGLEWDASAPATVGPVGAGQPVSLEVAVRIPPEALGGAYDEGKVVATSDSDPSQEQRATIKSVAAPRYGLSLEAGAPEQVGVPGSGLTYTLQLTNTGNITDSYALTLGAHTWPAELPAELSDLGPGAARALAVTIAIPSGAAAGASESVTVRATSRGGGATTATATLVARTPAEAPRSKVWLPLVAWRPGS